MSILEGFLIGFIVGFLVMGWIGMSAMDNKLKSGHIYDSEHNWYRVERE